MKHKQGGALVTMLAVLLAASAAALAILAAGIYSGLYNVAASDPHLDSTIWVLSHAMDQSVHRHARGLPVSPTYNSPDMAAGFRRYNELCMPCHGAPGVPRSPIGDGLNPPAPYLGEAAADWTPAEAYWIIKNGIKMSGMPGFGQTQSESDLWNLTAFVKRMPDMTPEQYHPMDAAAKSVTPGPQASPK